jgi:hypothetical protein
MIVAREGRWTKVLERAGKKTGVPGDEPEPTAPEIDHTQPMEGTAIIGRQVAEDTAYLGAPLPRIEQLPEGIVVKEDLMGRATGQWIVQIRCECGRRWFDVEMVQTARCPRCDAMLIVEPMA